MKRTTAFFDLDETLYPKGTSLWRGVRDRIEQYMHQRLGIPEDKVPEIRRQLFMQYGTTLRGLLATRSIDRDDYLDYVHNVPLDDLEPNPALRAMLLELPMKRVIFTNADRKHAHRVIEKLALGGCFDQIIDIIDITPHCKPHAEAFHIAMHMSGEPDGARCILVDDMVANLDTAYDLGFKTFYAGDDHVDLERHTVLPNLANLPALLDSAGNTQPAVWK